MKHFRSITALTFIAALSLMTYALFKTYLVFVPFLLMLITPAAKNAIGLNNIDARMVFNNAMQALARAFNYPPEQDMLAYFKMTQNALRLEQPIVAGQTLYTFPLLNNQGTSFPTEQRMKLQDTNVIYQIGIFFGLATGDTDPAEQLYTYPNPVVFPTSYLAMQALYNGLLLMTINNDQVLTQWDVARHEYRGQTQQTAALGAGSPEDQQRLSEDGFYAMEPNVTLIGQKDNNIQIKLPSGGIASPVTANSRIVIILRTILAQNSTAVS